MGKAADAVNEFYAFGHTSADGLGLYALEAFLVLAVIFNVVMILRERWNKKRR